MYSTVNLFVPEVGRRSTQRNERLLAVVSLAYHKLGIGETNCSQGTTHLKIAALWRSHWKRNYLKTSLRNVDLSSTFCNRFRNLHQLTLLLDKLLTQVVIRAQQGLQLAMHRFWQKMLPVLPILWFYWYKGHYVGWHHHVLTLSVCTWSEELCWSDSVPGKTS